MKFISTTMIALLISSGILSSCRTAARADSTFMGKTNDDSHLSSSDCEVWRLYLFNTLANIIYQSKNRESLILYRRLLKIDKHAKRPDSPFIHTHELLPAYKARKIIDTVLTLENGVCSRELLYETPCRAMRPSSGKRLGGIIQNYGYQHQYNSKYLSDVMGIPMNNMLAMSYEKFLRAHLSQSPGSKAEFYRFGCRDHGHSTCNRESVDLKSHVEISFSNSAGLCLLMKHHDYLKDNSLLNLRHHNLGVLHMNQIIAEDLEAFIKKSYELQDSYRSKGSDHK